MSKLIASLNRVLRFGYEGENNVTQIVFTYDESWLAYGNGEFKIRVLRNGDKEAYNATSVVDDREAMTLTMTVTDIELSKKGHGELQLVYICADSIKKSPIYRYNVNRAIDSEVVDPPEGSIIAEVEKSLAEIKDEIGSLADLTTEDKTSLVSAINEVNAKESGKTIYVDTELSGTSENPVQNKAIKAYVDHAVSHVTIDVDSELSATSENPVQNKAVKQYVDNATANKVTKFTVTISQENGLYVADKTYQQIAYAYIGGKDAVAVYNSITYPLFTIYNNTLFFGISGLLLGDVMTSGFAISQDNTVTPVNESIALSNELLNINTALDTKASTDTATQSANGLMSAEDKTKLDGLGNSGVSDVQINGTSIVSDGVAKIPIATGIINGVVKVDEAGTYGIRKWSNTHALLVINSATSSFIKNPNSGTADFRPLTPNRQHESTFYGLAKASGDTTQSASSNAVGTYTEEAKSAISDMLNGAVQVSGTTPTITALSGVRYVCGEVATLDITPCASGICDVVFTSGSTATVLTLPNTVKFPDGTFTPEANTTYEINIMDGVYGAVMAWT